MQICACPTHSASRATRVAQVVCPTVLVGHGAGVGLEIVWTPFVKPHESSNAIYGPTMGPPTVAATNGRMICSETCVVRRMKHYMTIYRILLLELEETKYCGGGTVPTIDCAVHHLSIMTLSEIVVTVVQALDNSDVSVCIIRARHEQARFVRLGP